MSRFKLLYQRAADRNAFRPRFFPDLLGSFKA
jgi:hypothetical protein